MSIRPLTLLALACSAPLFAQSGAARPSAIQQAASSQPRKPAGISVDGLISMVEAGLSDDVIIARIRKEAKSLDLSTDDMIRLKKAKVSDAVLKVALDPKTDLQPVTPPPAQTIQPVVTQPPPFVPGVTTARASGATPGPTANGTGDPDNPMTPHDSGIYLYTKDRDGTPRMIVLERASYQGSKTGGMLGSALTYGIVKAKTRAVFPGARANLRVTDSSPVFYFYFDDKQAGLGKTRFGIGSLSNPGQFALLKLDVKQSNRETVIGKFSMLGSSSGSDDKAMTPFKSERLRDGLYKVTVDNLAPGEYCFLASTGNLGVAGPYGVYSGGAGAADIFDFGISKE
jgi:hypothetical protein